MAYSSEQSGAWEARVGSFVVIGESSEFSRSWVSDTFWGMRQEILGFLTQARKSRIILLNGACDDEPETTRGTASANGSVA